MDSSSENSFAWTDTSSDSFKSASMARGAENIEENKNIDQRKRKKDKKLSCAKENTNSIELQPKVDIKEETEYRVNVSLSNGKKKKIKVEPDSENEKGKNKNKPTHKEYNGNPTETSSYDESYLDMKVKQEDTSSCIKLKKKKKQASSVNLTSLSIVHDDSNNHSSTDNVTSKHDSENDSEMSKSKKKKKKSKKKYDCDSHNNDQKMDIEEIVVQEQEKACGKHNGTNTSDVGNNTSQDESEECGYDDISAIKCDDSHSLHTISFINKSIEEDNSEINHNTSLISKLDKKSKSESESNNKSVKNQRTQSISDRIRFEDDEETHIEISQLEREHYSNNNKNSSKFKQFLKANPNLKLITQAFNNNSNITQDDEVWLLKCPKDININDFDDTVLNVHGKCKIKIGGQTYEGSAEEQSGTISLLAMENTSSKIENVSLSGIINLRKRIPKAHFRDDNIMVNSMTNFIPLPDTKCRHPLFGSNYKKALKIPAAIAERLHLQHWEKSRTEKKKKKNKKDKSISAIKVCPEEQSDIMMKTDPENSETKVEKQKKKRKVVDDDSPVPKKIKRVKHDPESAEAWESEKAIEENLFNF